MDINRTNVDYSLNLTNKIKSILFSIGINEKYVAFDYLSTILCWLITNNDNKDTYKKAIVSVAKQYGIATRTLTQGLSKVLTMCNKKEIISKYQFMMSNNGTFNKIKVVKQYIENALNEQ
ncbi:MAG: hypothetical protein IJ415_02445 [Clostridia bacterium]|nr:hypothetical protein [Clostridia bacterium]